MQPLYDLTDAESDICKLLAGGIKVDDIAESRNVTSGTVRSQIKTLFDKTNTSSQLDVVRLALKVNLPIN